MTPDKLVIFDIDGTLANIEHRRGYAQTKPSNWYAFNNTMHSDTPNEIVVDVYQSLADTGKYHMIIFTGRSERQHDVTVEWLLNNNIIFDELYMRSAEEEDKRVKDSIVKKRLLDNLIERHPEKEIMGVFDDRKQVVDMWLENGLFVFDVGQGKSDF